MPAAKGKQSISVVVPDGVKEALDAEASARGLAARHSSWRSSKPTRSRAPGPASRRGWIIKTGK